MNGRFIYFFSVFVKVVFVKFVASCGDFVTNIAINKSFIFFLSIFLFNVFSEICLFFVFVVVVVVFFS